MTGVQTCALPICTGWEDGTTGIHTIIFRNQMPKCVRAIPRCAIFPTRTSSPNGLFRFARDCRSARSVIGNNNRTSSRTRGRHDKTRIILAGPKIIAAIEINSISRRERRAVHYRTCLPRCVNSSRCRIRTIGLDIISNRGMFRCFFPSTEKGNYAQRFGYCRSAGITD